ncbi:hypothetical protein [Acidipropionibacterium virtanenii]|uniref:hypothetical protein n=1 Tax=Acidipropionibacterium virtanenii TaxID=2057246 RepID=UPI000DECBC1C|nr:hypothetical protein [Acidipropionibacterium virtanenii]
MIVIDASAALELLLALLLGGSVENRVAQDGRRLLNSLDIHYFNHQILSDRIWEHRRCPTGRLARAPCARHRRQLSPAEPLR